MSSRRLHVCVVNGLWCVRIRNEPYRHSRVNINSSPLLDDIDNSTCIHKIYSTNFRTICVRFEELGRFNLFTYSLLAMYAIFITKASSMHAIRVFAVPIAVNMYVAWGGVCYRLNSITFMTLNKRKLSMRTSPSGVVGYSTRYCVAIHRCRNTENFGLWFSYGSGGTSSAELRHSYSNRKRHKATAVD